MTKKDAIKELTQRVRAVRAEKQHFMGRVRDAQK